MQINSHGVFLRAEIKTRQELLPDGLDWLSLPLCSHREITISNIFLQFPHQKDRGHRRCLRIELKNHVRCCKNFSWYSTTLIKPGLCAPYNGIIFWILNTLCQILGNHSILLILHFLSFQSKITFWIVALKFQKLLRSYFVKNS